MNQPNSFSGNKWWLQADSGHRERMTSVMPNTNFSPSSSPVVQKSLPRKPDALGLEGRDGCEIIAENKGEVPLDERDGRFRWYLAEEKELALMIADRQSEPLQNCDLPTPYQRTLKNSLEGERNKPVAPSKSVSSDYDYSLLQSIGGRITETSECTTEHHDKKLDLLKALQLSQTRARVAERKASIMSMENENLLNLYFKGSARIFAYRQWVKLLELEILQLQSQGAISQSNGSSNCSEMSSDINGKKNQIDNYSNRAWYWAVNLCLSLASVGVVLTWRRGWRLSGLRGDDLPRLGFRLYPSAGFVRV